MAIVLSLSSIAIGQTAVVIKENANLRGAPSSSGKVVDVLRQNTLAGVIKSEGPWYLVQAPEYVGWIHGNTIEIVNKESPKASK